MDPAAAASYSTRVLLPKCPSEIKVFHLLKCKVKIVSNLCDIMVFGVYLELSEEYYDFFHKLTNTHTIHISKRVLYELLFSS